MKVHLFGAKSSPSCVNYALQKIPRDNPEFSESAKEAMRENFYVDDLLRSHDDEDILIGEALEIREMCKRSNFLLDKYKSNSRKLLNEVKPDDVEPETQVTFDKKDTNVPLEKTLGVCWETSTDVFSVETTFHSKPFTRRGVLSTVGSVYDPLGMVSPYILKGKLILQQLCRLKPDWDEELPEELVGKWSEWLSMLSEIKEVHIRRSFKPFGLEGVCTYQLHHFSDASTIAYAVVSYIRGVDERGNIFSSFLFGKTRVAPIKAVTVPRLELAAAALMIQVDKMIKESLNMIKFDQTFYWTDSQTVIKYIHNEDRRFQVFVANKLSLIHDHSTADQWRHIPTALNPADDGSRAQQTNRWLEGPDFLTKDEIDWPASKLTDLILDEDDKEVRCRTSIVPNKEHPLDTLINHFSSWYKLKKMVAWIVKVKLALMKKSEGVKHLKVADLETAESIILNHVQKVNFSNEFNKLVKNETVLCSSRIKQFNPFIHNKLIRIGGRLNNSDLSFNEKHPIILPNNNPVSNMIITEIHEEAGHQGREHVLSQIRKKFWILKGSSAVRSAIERCIKCKKIQKLPSNQLMAELPSERMAINEPPFSHTGVDFFGPFYVRVGRSQVKRYGVIFTCLTSRASHIEVAHSLDTSSFINALVRFTSRRGPVKYLRSDRGTNFIGAEKELREATSHIRDEEVSHSLIKRGIQWEFNAPHASHHGGIWERLIRTIRKIMNGLLNQQKLTDESLTTLMCEIENILNSRPLTPVSADARDLNPITPNHLLRLDGNIQSLGEFSNIDQYSRKRWRQIQHLANTFWFRFKNEYLRSLQSRSCWSDRKENLGIGDIVLMVDEMSPRCHWPLGKIVGVKTSKDSLIRTVIVKAKGNMFTRPITKVILLLKNQC